MFAVYRKGLPASLAFLALTRRSRGSRRCRTESGHLHDLTLVLHHEPVHPHHEHDLHNEPYPPRPLPGLPHHHDLLFLEFYLLRQNIWMQSYRIFGIFGGSLNTDNCRLEIRLLGHLQFVFI